VYLKIELLSDTTFARGDGTAGVVDNEVEHDAVTGLPIIKGRTVKGLVVEACADLLFGLSQFSRPAHDRFALAAQDLFGVPGSDPNSSGWLHFGTATLPGDLVRVVKRKKLDPQLVREAFTSVRRQTAVDPERDTPMDNTLRATRVVIRNTVFHAPISSEVPLGDDHLALLSACANTLRHAGMNRTRGLGHLRVTLVDAGPDDYGRVFEVLIREVI
jgi:CRISPR/Cas system CSM-associated protein Csm3 (group 7 of RAMP superfamily)